jgi:hypothetical protein
MRNYSEDGHLLTKILRQARVLFGLCSIRSTFGAKEGFKSKRVSVAQPISRTQSQPGPSESANRRSVFREFKDIFRKICKGDVRLYVVELRLRRGKNEIQGIEVASSGFSFEETRIIEQFYVAAADHLGKRKTIATVSLSIDHSNQISMDTWGMRHHGVLMLAEKGLVVHIPEKLLSGRIWTLWERFSPRGSKRSPILFTGTCAECPRSK